jgi:wobble nucleotide-excising tRNase
MDATVLHIVSMLVRDIADNCINPSKIKNVKQVFVLTHNAPFHIKPTNYPVNHYDVASYFHITKVDNVSHVKLCVKPESRRTGDFQNYNPMPSEYTGFWKEYKTVQSTLTLLNVMWQILDFYFVQMSEMDGDALIDMLLVINKERFIERFPQWDGRQI